MDNTGKNNPTPRVCRLQTGEGALRHRQCNIDMGFLEDERRAYLYDVFVHAFGADHQPLVAHKVDKPGRLGWRRRQRAAVRHQLHSDGQTGRANIADDVITIGKAFQTLIEISCRFRGPENIALLLDNIQNRKPCSCGYVVAPES